MASLHIINTSPNLRSALQACLDVCQTDDGVIFIEDAVLAVKQDTPSAQIIQENLAANTCYALLPDLQARGIRPEQIMKGIEQIDYLGFVKITTEYDRTLTWN